MDKLELINVFLNAQCTSVEEDITLVESISQVINELPSSRSIFEFIDEKRTFQKLAYISRNDITRLMVFQLLKQLENEDLSDYSRDSREDLAIEVMHQLNETQADKFTSLHFCVLTSCFIEDFFDSAHCFALLEPHFCQVNCDLKTHRILTLIMANLMVAQPYTVKREIVDRVCEFIKGIPDTLIKIEYLEFLRTVVEEQDVNINQYLTLVPQPVYNIRDSSSRICFLSKLIQIQTALTPFKQKSFLRSIRRGYLFDEYGATLNHHRLSAGLGYDHISAKIFDCILFLMNVSAERLTFPIDVNDCLLQHLITLATYRVDDSVYEKMLHMCHVKLTSGLFPPAFITYLYDCICQQRRFQMVEDVGLMDVIERDFGGKNKRDSRRLSYVHSVYMLPE